mmetsp:Transcript_46454/g.137240  ORF Transcript_46454/g.137240 Transcript_46454/m.137240 type:complete len:104 (-) Transcript_46454:138-449(-)
MPSSRQANNGKRYMRSHRAAVGGDEAAAVQRMRDARDVDALLEVFSPDVVEPAPPGMVRCWQCTLHNDKKDDKCVACGVPMSSPSHCTLDARSSSTLANTGAL